MTSKKGFTLIELLVVIAIIAILTGVTMVSLSQTKNQKFLESSARELIAVVREAQNNALTGKQIDGKNIKSFCVYGSGSSYIMKYVESGGTVSCNQGTTIASYDLKNGVVFSPAMVVTFSLPQAVSGGGQFTLTRDGSDISVCVDGASGKVAETAVNGSCP